MYARVSKLMAQFVLKIEKLSHIMGPAPILKLARADGLRPRLWLLVRLALSDQRSAKYPRPGSKPDHSTEKFYFNIYETLPQVI